MPRVRHPRAVPHGALALLSLLWFAAPARAADPGAAGAPADTAAVHPKMKPIATILAEADSAVRARGGSHAEDAQLFLTWDAPWGSKRARRERHPACADSTLGDTLYLAFQPGRDADKFTGFTARLMVRATGTDTLGNWWHMQGKGGENAGAMRAEWSALQSWPGARSAFRAQGQGMIQLVPERSVARIDMLYAVALPDAAPLRADSVYTLARIALRHQPARRTVGCDQPVVVEWVYSGLAFGPKDEPRVSRGERFVSFSGGYAITEPFRTAHAPVWKPPVPATPPPK